MAAQGHDVELIQESIKDIVLKSLIACEPKVVGKCSSDRVPRGTVFELFGYDVMLDTDLKAWLIEVNIRCSLASSSPLDKVRAALQLHTMTHCWTRPRNLSPTSTPTAVDPLSTDASCDTGA
jgi:hypothetical protein